MTTSFLCAFQGRELALMSQEEEEEESAEAPAAEHPEAHVLGLVLS